MLRLLETYDEKGTWYDNTDVSTNGVMHYKSKHCQIFSKPNPFALFSLQTTLKMPKTFLSICKKKTNTVLLNEYGNQFNYSLKQYVIWLYFIYELILSIGSKMSDKRHQTIWNTATLHQQAPVVWHHLLQLMNFNKGDEGRNADEWGSNYKVDYMYDVFNMD